MDKETLSNYGWIVICVLVLAVMLALATPFGTFVADAIKSTTQGLFDVNQNALNSTGLINIDGQEFDSCAHDYEVTTTTANCTTAGTTTHTCKLCGKSYSEEVPAGHKYDETGLKCTECGVTVVEYTFKPSDYDAKMGTTTATDANVVIPETFEYNGKIYKVTGVGGFSGNTSVQNVTIPECVKVIEYSAFQNCTNLKSINIPDKVTLLNDKVFSGCKALTTVLINENSQLTKVGYDCFFNCIALENIYLPNSLTELAICAFDYSGLKTIVIPDSVTSIGTSAFLGCGSLESVVIPRGITTALNATFKQCYKLSSITFKGTMEEWNNIPKGTSGDYLWNSGTATYVQCSDGQVSLK